MQSQIMRLLGLRGCGHGRRGGGGREELIGEHGYDTKYVRHAGRPTGLPGPRAPTDAPAWSFPSPDRPWPARWWTCGRRAPLASTRTSTPRSPRATCAGASPPTRRAVRVRDHRAPSYGIPGAGATAQLLEALGRHLLRPGHIHFKVSHPACRSLTTQIYFEGDPYIDSDVVGAVKDSLVIGLVRKGEADTRFSYDYVLTPSDTV